MRLIHNDKSSIYIEFHWPKFFWNKEIFNEFPEELLNIYSVEFGSKLWWADSKGPAFNENYWSFGLILLGFGVSVIGEKYAKQT